MLKTSELRQCAAQSGVRDIGNIEMDVLLSHLLQLFHERELLEHLRDAITPFQRELLDATVSSWLEKDAWILARELHVKFDKPKVVEALGNLGGSVVYEIEDSSASSRYQLSEPPLEEGRRVVVHPLFREIYMEHK